MAKAKQRPTSKKERKAKKLATIPAKFTPRFWDDADKRQSCIKEIRRRLEELRSDAGVDSFQKDLLAQRAVFVALQLETKELEALEGKSFDAGSYVQATNCLIGLLRNLGMSKQAAALPDLRAYVEGKKA